MIFYNNTIIIRKSDIENIACLNTGALIYAENNNYFTLKLIKCLNFHTKFSAGVIYLHSNNQVFIENSSFVNLECIGGSGFM